MVVRTILRDLKAFWVLDSRANPALEVWAFVERNGKIFYDSFIVPSGASTGEFEAIELRDNSGEFHGKGLNKAIRSVEYIKDKLINSPVDDMFALDSKLISLDGTENKSNLGANAILGVSMSVAKALAKSFELPFFKFLSLLTGSKDYYLPVPFMNVINGGVHADNDLDFQEFMICPIYFDSFSEALRAGSEIYNTLKKILKKDGYSISVGDEGGFAPELSTPFQACHYLMKAIEESGYSGRVLIALDVAASSMFENSKYKYTGRLISADELINIYEELLSNYPIISIEDPFAEEDWENWVKFTQKFGNKLNIVGDDLFVTNVQRLRKGIELKACNSILIKLNQIGTLTETINAIDLARKSGFTAIISHRSGETEDNTISHLATNIGYCIKTGAPARSERNSKYNELRRIEEFYNIKFIKQEVFGKFHENRALSRNI
ncbi:MAG: phosphopyruvate hydratase [Candidatus Calescibacterium sp.]|nr:phosphopyruvate hydratase [Candidatus Calescibacterium sp.]MDW8195282.1 phosphopyruvate hydratase [Candidatus Calescibacterium sp.]